MRRLSLCMKHNLKPIRTTSIACLSYGTYTKMALTGAEHFRDPERSIELGERLLEITQNIETRTIIQRQLQQARGNS